MEFTVHLTLSESEARALDALTSYGIKAFLETFYKHLGQDCLKPYEDGLTSLFSSIDSQLPPHLKRIDNTRKLFQEQNPNK